MQPDHERYLSSLGEEMLAQAARVRHLIGDKHWLSDGFHKETIFRSLLQRHLPSGVSCARGFVLGAGGEISREQDVVVFDESAIAPIFRSGDLAIIFAESVLALVSIKTRAGRTEILDSIQGLRTAARLCSDAWTGIYCFDDDPAPDDAVTLYRALADGFADGTFHVNLLATMEHLTVRISAVDQKLTILGFRAKGNGTAFLLGNLLASVQKSRNNSTSRFSAFLDNASADPLVPAKHEVVVPNPGTPKL